MRKVLIANRGEIALRVIRTCREMGIATLAVYSQADEQSLHVHLADEAICVGGPSSADSYLRADRILSAAEIGNVDAIHPGFGFLSESAQFAKQCEQCNIKLIGPSSTTIASMGDKTKAKEVAKKAKCPIIPGSEGAIDKESEALKISRKIGFPVIIKAVNGGGGRGMRLAYNAVSFSKEFHLARAEAQQAFGEGKVYIEKFIEAPKHIEIQVLADCYGKVIHLGERDCSIQRRYQKLIEEAPSPVVSPKLRAKMGAAAVRVAEACGYENAGTVEFLLDKHGNFYFIEMNTRIQVEHPVTEEATGIDLIKRQLSIAAGEALDLEQKQISFKAHAIECRINAENPARNFAPCPGKVDFYYPPGGHGVRVDSHLYQGYVVPPHYDSMVSKLIVSGLNRQAAIARMKRALGEYLISGIETSIPLLLAVMDDPPFSEGKFTTNYLDGLLKRLPAESMQAPASKHLNL